MGFQAHDGEGKLMGLAAYGKKDPELFKNITDKPLLKFILILRYDKINQ